MREFINREQDRNLIALATSLSSFPGFPPGFSADRAQRAAFVRTWINANTHLAIEYVQCSDRNMTGITDEMVEFFKKMKNLKSINFRDNKLADIPVPLVRRWIYISLDHNLLNIMQKVHFSKIAREGTYIFGSENCAMAFKLTIAFPIFAILGCPMLFIQN